MGVPDILESAHQFLCVLFSQLIDRLIVRVSSPSTTRRFRIINHNTSASAVLLQLFHARRTDRRLLKRVLAGWRIGATQATRSHAGARALSGPSRSGCDAGAALGAAQGWWAGCESAARAGGRCTFGGMAGDALLAVSGLWVLSRWCSWCCECGDE